MSPDEIEVHAMNIADELKRAVGKEKAFDPVEIKVVQQQL